MNFENRSTFAKSIMKHQVAYFLRHNVSFDSTIRLICRYFFRGYTLKTYLVGSILHPKRHRIFRPRVSPGPAGELTAFPRHIAGQKGAYF